MFLNIKFTNAGIAALVNPDNVGTSALNITQIELGTESYDPTGDETELRSLIKTLDTFGGETVANNTIHVSIRDDSDDSYQLGEIGLRTEDGVLFGIISSSELSPITQKGTYDILLLTADNIITELDISNVTFGNSDFMYPDASTTSKGIVQLTNDPGADNETQAVTPKAMKSAIEGHSNTPEQLPAATTVKQGAVVLEDVINDSQSKAATPKAVKQAILNHSHTPEQLPAATTEEQGAVKLSHDIDSGSESTAATSKALRNLGDTKAPLNPGKNNGSQYSIGKLSLCSIFFPLELDFNFQNSAVTFDGENIVTIGHEAFSGYSYFVIYYQRSSQYRLKVRLNSLTQIDDNNMMIGRAKIVYDSASNKLIMLMSPENNSHLQYKLLFDYEMLLAGELAYEQETFTIASDSVSGICVDRNGDLLIKKSSDNNIIRMDQLTTTIKNEISLSSGFDGGEAIAMCNDKIMVTKKDWESVYLFDENDINNPQRFRTTENMNDITFDGASIIGIDLAGKGYISLPSPVAIEI